MRLCSALRIRLRRRDLVHVDHAVVEGVGASGEVQVPDPENLVGHQLSCLLALLPKAPKPFAQRQCIMSSEPLDVSAIRSLWASISAFAVVPLGCKLGTGKTCLKMKAPPVFPRLLRSCNAVIQEEPAGAESAVNRAQVRGKLGGSNMLAHAHRADLAERASLELGGGGARSHLIGARQARLGAVLPPPGSLKL